MAYLNITDQEKLFNEFISKGVTNLIRSKSKVFDQVRKDWSKIDVEGLYAKQKLMLAGSESTGAASTNDYPTPQQSTPGNTIVYIKRAQMFSMGFDGFALEAAARKGAEMPPLDFEREGLFIRMADDLSRQLIMDGSGRLAKAGAGSGSTTMTITKDYFAKATKFLKATRYVDIYEDGDPAALEGEEQVASVDSNTQITLEVLESWTSGSYLFNKNVYVDGPEAAGEGEMMGLLGIITDADPPRPCDAGLQGLPVATNAAWKAQVFDNPLGTGGTDRDIEEDLFIQVLDETEPYGVCNVILASPGVYRSYYDLLISYKTLPNQKKLWGGWTGLVFIYNGREIPVVSDNFVPDGYAFFISDKNLILHVMTPNMIQWERGLGGAGILKQVAGKHAYVAEGHMYMNLATGLRPAFGVLRDIAEP